MATRDLTLNLERARNQQKTKPSLPKGKRRDIDEGYVLTDDSEIHYLELNKFDDTKNIEEMDIKELWLTFIKDAGEEGKEDIFERIKERSEIKMAVEMPKKISSDEIMRQKYLEREKARLDYKSQLYHAELKGIKKGIEIVKIEGCVAEAKSILVRLIKKKFGGISTNCTEQINIQTDVDKLEKIIEEIFDIKSEEEILELLI